MEWTHQSYMTQWKGQHYVKQKEQISKWKASATSTTTQRERIQLRRKHVTARL